MMEVPVSPVLTMVGFRLDTTITHKRNYLWAAKIFLSMVMRSDRYQKLKGIFVLSFRFCSGHELPFSGINIPVRNMGKDIYRVVTQDSDGQFVTWDYADLAEIKARYQQTGTDNCSIRNSLRGLPIFRGLIGPMAEGPSIVRYETPSVFEALTQEWYAASPVRRRRKRDSK